MSELITVVIPVKDGARYLRELLDALAGEAVDEILVIDSGSHDDSLAIARAAGATVLEILPADFGHGRTRNLGADRASGDIVAFLTQDATPAPGWLAAMREAFALSEDIGAVFGPHLPRPDTSPMIARELTEFFATFAPYDAPPLSFDEPTFLSNVNAAYRRACWAEIRFDDVSYSEDQAFGRAVATHPHWTKAYAPAMAVLHAHDYPPLEFMRRYFDEYRGLHETIGHVEPFGVRSAARDVRGLVAADRRFIAGLPTGVRARWTARSIVHHAGRKTFSSLGSRSDRLPAAVQRAFSLEGRASNGQPPTVAAPPAPALPPLIHRPATPGFHAYEGIARALQNGPAPLLTPYPGMADRERLHIAFAIPTFDIGSGGHNIIAQLVLRLERMGHICSIWVHDLFGHRPHDGAAVLRKEIRYAFAPVNAPVFREFDAWYGADVVVATGWQTVYPVLELDQVRARAYLINDHEPEFFPTSVESELARMTYGLGLYGIAGSPWLRDLYIKRYGGRAGSFQYGVDQDVYFPRPVGRRSDTVVAYARSVTPRRALGLAILALEELRRRRPDVRVVLFGDQTPPFTPFAFDHAGVAGHEALAWLFSEATAGLCLSLTNYSLMPQEMLACGLPCVDLNRPSARSVFGADGPVMLADFDRHAIADCLERLLDDEEEWARRSQLGLDFVREHTWDAASEQVERELRNALRERERAQP
jgi:glycosyltransferase involved in cell wall biosynthesis